ncbi:hypothetical protein JXA47_11325 [Candidatus Sumerlaeota bacterium]|nr:hypothetical protein [Candidatus Sumerlaeota bacterium]
MHRILILILLLSPIVSAQTQEPAITMKGPTLEAPDIDPDVLTAQPFNGFTQLSTFHSFMSSSFAFANVWIVAENDDPGLYSAQVVYPYPPFYQPTWGEIFDHIARQMRCEWQWDPDIRQFVFRRSESGPIFQVNLEEGWISEDRGLYSWFAPEGLPCGMDIYDLGHFTQSEENPDLFAEVREHFALRSMSLSPDPPSVEDMEIVSVADFEALYHHCAGERPGSVWRQWSFVAEGHAILIVSALPGQMEATLAPQVDRMVQSFRLIVPQSDGEM